MLIDERGRPLTRSDATDTHVPARPGATSEYLDEAARTVEAIRSGRMDAAGVSRETFDAFVNELSGLGDPSFDKTRGGYVSGPRYQLYRLSSAEAEARERGNDLGGNIVNKIPDEMTRRGWDIEVQPTEDETAIASDPRAHADAARAAPLRAAAGWRRWARSGRLDARQRRVARDRARRWDEVARGIVPPSAAPPPPPGALPQIDSSGLDLGEAIENWATAVGVVTAINQALRYERAFGGGCVFIGVDDGARDLTEPLDPAKVRAITHLTPFAGGWDGDVTMWRAYNDPRKPKFGKPEIFQVRNRYVSLARPPAPGEGPVSQAIPGGPAGATIFYVHESRFLIFDGEPTSVAAQQQNMGWGDSVFTRANDPLFQYEQTWSAVAVLMQEFSIATLGIPNFSKLLAEKGQAARAQFIEFARLQALIQSVARMRYHDADQKFERVTASVAGIAELLREWDLRIAAAADTPASILFGRLSGGLGANEDPSMRGFYDRIQGRQETRLRPQLEYLYRLAWRAKNSPTRGREPERWALLFRPLWQLTETEQADVYGKYATADVAYITNNVLMPEEVAAHRFGGPEFNTSSVVIDFELRRASAAGSEMRAAPIEGVELGGDVGNPAAAEAHAANANPIDVQGVPRGATPPSSGAASITVPPMTAMPSDPITGDPQATPSNVSSNTEREPTPASQAAKGSDRAVPPPQRQPPVPPAPPTREASRAPIGAPPRPDAPPVAQLAAAPSTEAAPFAPTPETAKDPGAALNGAQVSSLREIVASVARRELPRESGVAMMLAAFPITADEAERIMGPVGRTFFAEEEPPPVPAPPPGKSTESPPPKAEPSK